MFDEYSDDEIDLDLIAKSSKDIEDEEAAEVKEKGINAVRIYRDFYFHCYDSLFPLYF